MSSEKATTEKQTIAIFWGEPSKQVLLFLKTWWCHFQTAYKSQIINVHFSSRCIAVCVKIRARYDKSILYYLKISFKKVRKNNRV